MRGSRTRFAEAGEGAVRTRSRSRTASQRRARARERRRPRRHPHSRATGTAASLTCSCLREGATEGVTLEDIVGDLAVLLAGCAIERRTWPGSGVDADTGRAWALARAHTDSEHEAQALIGFAEAKLRTLLDSRAVAEAIERLSDALLDRGQLSSDEITHIIEGGSNGTT
jgi:hypothetical protein